MTNEGWIGTKRSWANQGIIPAFAYMYWRRQRKPLSWDNWCLGGDSNRAPSEYKCRALPLHQLVCHEWRHTCHITAVLAIIREHIYSEIKQKLNVNLDSLPTDCVEVLLKLLLLPSNSAAAQYPVWRSLYLLKPTQLWNLSALETRTCAEVSYWRLCKKGFTYDSQSFVTCVGS
jgi:hypothetical protein